MFYKHSQTCSSCFQMFSDVQRCFQVFTYVIVCSLDDLLMFSGFFQGFQEVLMMSDPIVFSDGNIVFDDEKKN